MVLLLSGILLHFLLQCIIRLGSSRRLGSIGSSGSRSVSTTVDGPACAAYLDLVLLPLPAVARLGTAVCTWVLCIAVGILMLLYEGFLILVCDWDPSLQRVVKLELGTVGLLDSDELVVELGERDAVVILELGWVCREGEDLRDWLLCHFCWELFS